MALGRYDKLGPPQLVITLHHRFEEVVLSLVGEMDVATVADLGAAIDQIVTNDAVTAMHIDTVKVTFVDSSGLRSLMQAHDAAVAHGLLFTLRSEPGGQVERVITLSGLDGTLNDYTPHTPDG